MSRNHVLLLVAVLVGIGLAVWLLGGGLLSDGDAVLHDPEDGIGGAMRGAGGTGDGSDAGEAVDAGPVLFGRPARERVGRGIVHGKVLTAATNEPVAGAKVLLTGTGFGGESVAWRGETDADGGFRIPEIPAGDDYELLLEAKPLPGRMLPGVTVRDGTVTELGTLWLGARVALAGRVVDESGHPVPGAAVSVHAGHFSLMDMFGNMVELFSNLDRQPEPLARTTTDGRGAFAFEALDPGKVTVTVRAVGYEPLYSEAVVAEGVEKTPLVLRMLAGGVVAGRVVDAEGAGIAGARVAAVSSENPQSFLFGRSFTQTEADGSFRIDAAASTDEVMLLAGAPGYAVRLHKTKPGTTDVRIVLDASATLVVRVLGKADGEPVAGASVMLGISASGALQGSDPQTIVSGVTDPTGRISCDVPPGKIQMVMVSCPTGQFGMWTGGAPGFQNPMFMEGPKDDVVKAGRQEVVFRVQDSVLVTGTIRDEQGVPVVGARVVGSAGLQLARPAYSDESGRYRVRQNRQGFSLLLVRADGFVPHQETIQDLAQASEAEHDVTLKRAAIVTGRVLDAQGLPLAGARVRAKHAQQGGMGFSTMGFLGAREGLTDAQGHYVLDGVSPGEKVRVMARHTSTADGLSEPFEVGVGGSVRAPDVTLRPGKRIDVVVRDPDGRPLAGARVELSFDRAEMPAWDALDVFSNDVNLVTNAQGHVTEDRIPACELTVTATHADFARGKAVKTLRPESVSPVRVEVSVTVPVEVTGQVLDGSGRPIEGAWVTAQPEGETIAFQRTTTDEEGRFDLEGVPDGAYTLRANKPGYRAYEADLTGGQEGLVVTLSAVDPEVAARRTELQAKIAEVYGRLSSAKNDQEREAISAEIQALSAELQGLTEEPSAADR